MSDKIKLEPKLPAIPASLDPVCSASRRTIPIKMLRLVIQVDDTPSNRLAMADIHTAVKCLKFPMNGSGVMKQEEVTILTMEMPRPNVKVSDRPERPN